MLSSSTINGGSATLNKRPPPKPPTWDKDMANTAIYSASLDRRAIAAATISPYGMTHSTSSDKVTPKFPPPAPTSSPRHVQAAQQKVGNIVAELMETEKSFVDSLGEVVKGYIFPLRDNNVLTPSEEKKIFSNVSEIFEFHKDFLCCLCQDNGNVSSIAKRFSESATPLLRLYSPYCINYCDAITVLESMRMKDSTTKWSHLVSCQTSLQHQLPLATYLLKPVQRILKYHLLLQELWKAQQSTEVGSDGGSGESSSVLCEVDDARLAMLRVADELNMAMQVHQLHLGLRHHLCQLNDPRLPREQVDQLGHLVLCDHFRLVGKRQPRFVWLFHSAMLLGKPRSWEAQQQQQQEIRPDPASQVTWGTAAMASSGLVLKEMIQCKNLMLIECIPNSPLSFHVLPFDNPKSQVTLQAQTAAQKQLWCQEIKRLILEHYDKAIPDRVRDMLLHMGEDSTATAAPDRKVQVPGLAMEGNRSPPLADESCNVDREVWSALSVYQPLVQRHRRNLSTATTATTTELLSLWDDIVAKHAMDSPSGDSPTEEGPTGMLPESSGTSSRAEELVQQPIHFSDDMDFRCIAVEINMERLFSNTSEGAALLAAVHDNYTSNNSELHRKEVTTDNNQQHPGSKKMSSLCTYASYAETLDNAGGDMMSVYEAYISRARSDVELTFEDLEEILRPLRQLRAPCHPPRPAPAPRQASTPQAPTTEQQKKEIPIYAKVIPKKDRPKVAPAPPSMKPPAPAEPETCQPAVPPAPPPTLDSSRRQRKLPPPPKPSIDRSVVQQLPLSKPPSPPQPPTQQMPPPKLPRSSATLTKRRGDLPVPPPPNVPLPPPPPPPNSVKDLPLPPPPPPPKNISILTLPHTRSHSIDSPPTTTATLVPRKKTRAPPPPGPPPPQPCVLKDTPIALSPCKEEAVEPVASVPVTAAAPPLPEKISSCESSKKCSPVPLAKAEEDLEEEDDVVHVSAGVQTAPHNVPISAASGPAAAIPQQPSAKGLASLMRNLF